jgi:hypothetical protein
MEGPLLSVECDTGVHMGQPEYVLRLAVATLGRFPQRDQRPPASLFELLGRGRVQRRPRATHVLAEAGLLARPQRTQPALALREQAIELRERVEGRCELTEPGLMARSPGADHPLRQDHLHHRRGARGTRLVESATERGELAEILVRPALEH